MRTDRLWHCHALCQACSMGLLYSTSANRAKGAAEGAEGCQTVCRVGGV